eukprot:sb/3477504/
MNWHPTNQPTYAVEHPSVYSLNSSHFRENSDGYTRPIKTFQEIAQHLAQQESTPEQRVVHKVISVRISMARTHNLLCAHTLNARYVCTPRALQYRLYYSARMVLTSW